MDAPVGRLDSAVRVCARLVAALDALVADLARRARSEPRPVDWGEVLRDSLDDEQRHMLDRVGYFLVDVRDSAVRVCANGTTPGFCIWPAAPPDFVDEAERLDAEAPNPWVAYQKKLWLEASPEVFVAVANHPYRSNTVRVTAYSSGGVLPSGVVRISDVGE